jgi:type I restriction enzyme R subunit
VALYKAVAALVRAYAALSDCLPEAGYSAAEVVAIEQELARAVALRETIRQASGETLDLKAYEADMRHLIDTYIRAEEARTISDFGGLTLLDLIVRSGIADAIASLPKGIQGDRDAVAETIANNVRSKISREHLRDPAFFDKMSVLLAEVLAELKAQRIDYQEFLKRVASLAAQVQAGEADDTPEPLKRSPGLRAIYNMLASAPATGVAEAAPADSGWDRTLATAQRIDTTLRTSAPDGWRGVLPKEQEVKRLVYQLVHDTELVERLFPVIKAQAEY